MLGLQFLTIKILDNDWLDVDGSTISHWMWLSLQKLEMTDFMEEDVKFTL